MSERDLREDQDRGIAARTLLENELLNEALAAIDREVMEQWIDCPARDKEGKEALWQLIKTSRKFRSVLNGYIESGKLATEQLKRYEKGGWLDRVRG
ncbi:hypothetical protein [Pseudomonas sp.]|uniref:hypothetical protein n=1 Tax=Pseudomonas sp. TaxID=306 RepID=UPI00258579D8|nr:hypothetical protein [Pseudomonas sp.]